MLSKKCAVCGEVFYKDYKRSKRDFLERAKYCSNRCKAFNLRFYRHWEGKKRNGLKNTGAANTMFTKENPGICPPEKLFRKHGLSNSKFYRTWISMNSRCYNENIKNYKNYGGRGIRVEWRSFDEFKHDMYEQYENQIKKNGSKNISIDRIDNNGNYSKTNCRWTTRHIQMRNKRNNHMITFNGKTQCITDWAREIGISYSTLWKRLKKMSTAKSITGYEI